MKISYSDDSQRGPGHGILTCREAVFLDGPYAMAVLRASDQASLAGAGGGAVWVGETRFIPVKTEATPDGALNVLLGPEVVDALDPQEQYMVTLKPAQGEPLKGRLRVQGITYSPQGALDNTGMRPAGAEKPAPEPAPPTPEPASAPEAAPQPAEAPAPEAALSANEALTLAPEAPARSRRLNPVLLVALAAALLAGGLATWKFFDSKAQEEEAALAGKPAPEAPAPAATTLPATQKTAEEQVRAFFSGPDITAQAALKLAAELPKATPAEQDAVYRLYYFAAENEAPGAFMPYAACLDPAEPKWGSIDKDAAAAYAAYAKAAASDPKAAKAALDAQTRLRAWLDREAQGGNAQARAWLQELP